MRQASDEEVRRQQKRLEHARQLVLAEARKAERRAERIEAAREQAGGASPRKAPQGEGGVESTRKSL